MKKAAFGGSREPFELLGFGRSFCIFSCSFGRLGCDCFRRDLGCCSVVGGCGLYDLNTFLGDRSGRVNNFRVICGVATTGH